MANITMPGVTLKDETYRDCIISWQEPPMMGDAWRANVSTDSPNLFALFGRNGAKVIEGRNRDEMIAGAKEYIDGLLG